VSVILVEGHSKLSDCACTIHHGWGIRKRSSCRRPLISGYRMASKYRTGATKPCPAIPGGLEHAQRASVAVILIVRNLNSPSEASLRSVQLRAPDIIRWPPAQRREELLITTRLIAQCDCSMPWSGLDCGRNCAEIVAHLPLPFASTAVLAPRCNC